MSTTYEDGHGGHITILERGDESAAMRFRMVMPKGFGPPSRERHPLQREDFRVLRGVLDLGRIEGARVVLRAGDSYSLLPDTYHLPANAGDDELEFEATLTPGLDAADMFAALYTATRDHRGVAQFARVAAIFRRYAKTIAFPFPVRTVMGVVATLASLFRVQPPDPAHRDA